MASTGSASSSMNPTPDDTTAAPAADGQAAKRSRVLLSCAACRASKLKCDRAQPCGQCLKKGRGAADCVYAPRPEKGGKKARSMAARLKRLEGMVRGMIDSDGTAQPPGTAAAAARDQAGAEGDGELPGRGQVVSGEGLATTYVGATHFMAILDDIEDLKNYFDDQEDAEAGNSPGASPEENSPDLFMLSGGIPRTRDDLLDILPPRQVVDRLVMRYFMSNTPSQHVVHRPTFVKQYNEFWKDPSKVSLHWLALLFMLMALATYFSIFSAPHEISGDSPRPPLERFKEYRAAAGWALVAGRYSNPSWLTLQPFVLYVEADFFLNRSSQLSVYLLSSVSLRLMLKMGLHRDPSKLANISPFEGEMRRRLWNFAVQIDLLVAFHVGLPSMIYGIESDVTIPRNLLDEDFGEDSAELPTARPDTEYTAMSYSIWKSTICRVFGLVARQAHSLTQPTYAEVMKLDNLLEEKYASVPSFLKVKPMEESIIDTPTMIVQRFGIAALYQKSRCVLHRRYLAEPTPRREHEYSRRTCLAAALSLLDYQATVHAAAEPGGPLFQAKWFLTSLAVHDFLLAAMIVYLTAQGGERYSPVGGDYDWMTQGTPLPGRDELVDILRRSGRVWRAIALESPELRKQSEIIDTMLAKIERRQQRRRGEQQQQPTVSGPAVAPARMELDPALMARLEVAPVGNLRVTGAATQSRADGGGASIPNGEADLPVHDDSEPNGAFDPSSTTWWPANNTAMDWTSFDDALRTGNLFPDQGNAELMPDNALNDLEFMGGY